MDKGTTEAERYPWLPSNGTEFIMFEEKLCSKCRKDAKFRASQDGADGCVILREAIITGKHNKEWTMDKDCFDWKCSEFIEGDEPWEGTPAEQNEGCTLFDTEGRDG